MKTIKRLWRLFPPLFLWLFISVFLWSWIFTFLTDTSVERKVTLFIDEERCEDVRLAARLEEALPASLRMVKVHPFKYAMLNGAQLRASDLYIVRASDMEEYRDWFRPLPAEYAQREGVFCLDGTAYGLPMYSAARGTGAAAQYIAYTEDCYLCFGASSRHLRENPDAVDDAARVIAAELLTLIDR